MAIASAFTKKMEFEGFEWDESKRLDNLAKHKIDFEDVHDLFANPFLSKRSDRHGEQRHVAIGSLRDRIIAVVYTIRENRCRLISARKARTNEREAYYHAFEGQASQRKD
jgi:uncharacterized DUF497 family protein